jgi:hypothetical protein
MSLRCVVCAVTLATVLGVPAVANAQKPAAPIGPAKPAGPPSAPPTSRAESMARAEALYKQGVRLYVEKKWAEAEGPFQQAWALNPTADVAYNLGSVEFRLGKYRDAAEHLAFALRNWPLMDAMAKQRPIAEQRLREARAAVGALTVKVSVPYAEVLVDGKSVGKAPLLDDVFVTPGAPHTVEAKLEGYASAKESVQLQAGATRTLDLALTALPSGGGLRPLDPEKGGEDGGANPPGSAAGTASIEGGPSKPLIIGGIASSAALVTAGVVFAIVSSVHGADADEQLAAAVERGVSKPCAVPANTQTCETFTSTLRARDDFGNASLWTFAVGGALGVGTVVYMLAAPKPKPVSGIRAVPVAMGRGGGVVITGEW